MNALYVTVIKMDIRVRQILPYWENLQDMKHDAISMNQFVAYSDAWQKFTDFAEPLIPAEMSLNEFIAFAKKHNNWNDD